MIMISLTFSFKIIFFVSLMSSWISFKKNVWDISAFLLNSSTLISSILNFLLHSDYLTLSDEFVFIISLSTFQVMTCERAIGVSNDDGGLRHKRMNHDERLKISIRPQFNITKALLINLYLNSHSSWKEIILQLFFSAFIFHFFFARFPNGHGMDLHEGEIGCVRLESKIPETWKCLDRVLNRLSNCLYLRPTSDIHLLLNGHTIAHFQRLNMKFMCDEEFCEPLAHIEDLYQIASHSCYYCSHSENVREWNLSVSSFFSRFSRAESEMNVGREDKISFLLLENWKWKYLPFVSSEFDSVGCVWLSWLFVLLV